MTRSIKCPVLLGRYASMKCINTSTANGDCTGLMPAQMHHRGASWHRGQRGVPFNTTLRDMCNVNDMAVANATAGTPPWPRADSNRFLSEPALRAPVFQGVTTPPATSLHTQSSPALGAPSGSRQVIYADDMQELRELVRIVLGREGYAVETVADGKQAYELITATPGRFDLVITDHHMPAMNGLELVRRLKAGEFQGRILVFSSELSLAVHREYLELGVDRVLHKPVFPSKLREILAEMFV